jgi:hypothetical protein
MSEKCWFKIIFFLQIDIINVLQIDIINVFPHPKFVVEGIGGDALKIAIDKHSNWVWPKENYLKYSPK